MSMYWTWWVLFVFAFNVCVCVCGSDQYMNWVGGLTSVLYMYYTLPSPSQTTNITTLEVGPANLMLRDNQKLVAGPHPFVKVPPGYYCIVKNPIDPT